MRVLATGDPGGASFAQESCCLQRLQRNIECISFRHSVPEHHAHAYYLSRHGSTHTSRCSPSTRNAPCPCLHATSTSSIMRHRLPDLNVMPCSRPNCTCTCPHRCPSGLPGGVGHTPGITVMATPGAAAAAVMPAPRACHVAVMPGVRPGASPDLGGVSAKPHLYERCISVSVVLPA